MFAINNIITMKRNEYSFHFSIEFPVKVRNVISSIIIERFNSQFQVFIMFQKIYKHSLMSYHCNTCVFEGVSRIVRIKGDYNTILNYASFIMHFL